MTKIIDGKALAQKIRNEIKKEVMGLKTKPALAVIIVGVDEASRIYVASKHKACKEVGIESYNYELLENTTEKELLALIQKLNLDNKITGILVQSPLPKHIDERKVIESIDIKKDVDCFHPINVGRMVVKAEYDSILPATPKGIIRLIESTNEDISGKHAVVIGRSNIVGKPTGMLLLQKSATVTYCHSKTKDLPAITKQADILVAAIGKENMITGEMIKKGAIIIDVGINRVNGKLYGDVDFESVKEKASFITPVPGGVGPMTIAMLLENTLIAYKKRK